MKELFDAVPPQDLHAETCLIGGLILDARQVDSVADVVRSEDFYLTTHGEIFNAIFGLYSKSRKVDAVTLANELKRLGKYDESQTPGVLVEAMNAVPHAGHCRSYAEIVAGHAARRNVVYACTDAIQQAFHLPTDVDDVLAETETRLHKIVESRVKSTPMEFGSLLIAAQQALDPATRQPGVTTGFQKLDWLFGGFKPGNLIVLAARPSVGKTSFAGNLTVNAAKAGNRVLFVSLEQTRLELAQRLLCCVGQVSSNRMHDGVSLTDDDRHKLVEASNTMGSWPLLIDDTTPRTVAQIAAVARLDARRAACKLVVIDYLQLITADDKRAPREQQVAEISKGLKSLAKQLELPVIVLAQLNRQIEMRENKRPKLSDLRESGSIEQDADVVIFLDRPATYMEKDKNGYQVKESEASAIVAKHRNGKIGDVPLYWNAEWMTFNPIDNAYGNF